MRFLLNTDILHQIHACPDFKQQFMAQFPEGIDVEWAVDEQFKLLSHPLLREHIQFGLQHLDTPVLPLKNTTIQNMKFKETVIAGLRYLNSGFSKCSFKQAYLSGWEGSKGSFNDCNMKGVSLVRMAGHIELIHSPLRKEALVAGCYYLNLKLHQSPIKNTSFRMNHIEIICGDSSPVKNILIERSQMRFHLNRNEAKGIKAEYSSIGGMWSLTDIIDSNFDTCELQLDFSCTRLHDVHFVNCDLSHCTFQNNELINCSFMNCKLPEDLHQLLAEQDVVTNTSVNGQQIPNKG